MLTTAQRIDLLKVAADLSKTIHAAENSKETGLDALVLDIFRKLKAEIEQGTTFDPSDISDVKAAVDVASSLDGLIE